MDDDGGEAQEGDVFYRRIWGMDPLFDVDEEDDADAAKGAPCMADGVESGGGANDAAKGAHGSIDAGYDTNKASVYDNADDGVEHALPPGFDAAAAAAAAKQRVERQAATAVAAAKPNPGGGGVQFEKTAEKDSAYPVSVSANTASTSASSACTAITATLCAGLWNGAPGRDDDAACGGGGRIITILRRGEGNGAAAAAETTPPVRVLPESLSINRRAPTCWQTFGHRLRKTKAEF